MAKKKLAARIYDAIFPPKRSVTRMYAAARLNRQNSDWSTQVTSANWELRQSIRPLRARARQAARDNSHFKKYLDLVRTNVVGAKGIQLQSNARRFDQSLDVDLNKTVEAAFKMWGHCETCTVSGKLDWLAVQRLAVTHLARDGEFLVQKVAARNAFGFSLKVINVDYLDEYFTQPAPNGNRIIMSIEIDVNDKPVAYWLTTPGTEIMYAPRQERLHVRVPAEEMLHGFLTLDDESQVRGVTWFHAAMLDAKNFQSYREGVIQSARMASNTLGILEQTNPDEEGQYDGSEDPETGRLIAPEIDVSPLSFNQLPPGMTMKQFDPKQPTQQHAEFTRTIEHTIAAGLGINHFELTGNLEEVNLSTARVGAEYSRDQWRTIQDFVAKSLCREVFHAWAQSAFLSGALDITARQLTAIQNPEWRGRGWSYMDPLKEVQADIAALENNLTTYTDVLAEKGVDLTDFLERRQSELELGKKYHIDLVAVTSVKVAENAPPPPEDTPKPPKRYLNGHDPDEMIN